MRRAIRVVGEAFITFGLIILLFAGYEVWGKSMQVNAAQGKLEDKLDREWAAKDKQPQSAGAPKDKAIPGGALARMYIPRLNKKWVVVEGVDPGDIEDAPGHYPRSALPGEKGNFAMAGHRMPAIFWNLEQVQEGDYILVETRTTWYVYQVTVANKIVSPKAVEVVAPVPDQPGAAPSKAMLTITTCNPKWDNYQRLVVHAEMRKQQARKNGEYPPELPKDMLK